jgi:hypothetical protein
LLSVAAGRNSNGNRSSLLAVGLPHGAAAAAAAAAAGDRSQSVYLEHSLEDSDVLVMRTMSDWSQDEVDGSLLKQQQGLGLAGGLGGASSTLEQQQQSDMLRPGERSYHRSRSQMMPLIEEGEGEGRHEGTEEEETQEAGDKGGGGG